MREGRGGAAQRVSKHSNSSHVAGTDDASNTEVPDLQAHEHESRNMRRGAVEAQRRVRKHSKRSHVASTDDACNTKVPDLRTHVNMRVET